jgi:hypothetical protein
VVPDFRWEDPDVIILGIDGRVIERFRIGAMEEYIGWLGGTVWVPEESSPH